MLLVFTPELKPRIKYIFDLIFREILKKEYVVTTSQQTFQEHQGEKFSYGKLYSKDHLHFHAACFLYEENIRHQEIQVEELHGLKAFFQVDEGQLSFDPFAAAFYLVSRYEEYIPSSKDRHNRFKAEESIAYKNGFLQKAQVNHYAALIKETIISSFPESYFPHLTYSFTPTLDIDNAFAFKHKGALRAGMAIAKQFVTFNFGELTTRMKVYSGVESDPYDSFDKQFVLHEQYHVKPTYFFLLGNYGPFDKNLSHNNTAMVNLIKRVKDKAKVGIHPSYSSNSSSKQLAEEKRRLEKITGDTVTLSRQHYLKLNFPETYQNLIDIGITDDYTMGYPSQIGFRASICNAFYFYDLKAEKQTSLRIHPFAAMDTTFKFYLKVRSSEVCMKLKPLCEEVKKLGGNFTILFHNESIAGKKKPWTRWGNIYEQVLKLATS